jgi:hypothetical protein
MCISLQAAQGGLAAGLLQQAARYAPVESMLSRVMSRPGSARSAPTQRMPLDPGMPDSLLLSIYCGMCHPITLSMSNCCGRDRRELIEKLLQCTNPSRAGTSVNKEY